MKAEDINKVLVVGAGNMGQQIGAVCAIHGLEVVLYDIKQEILDVSMARIGKLMNYLLKTGRISKGDPEEAMGRISVTLDMGEAAVEADLLSESVPEDPDLKGRVFSLFNGLCPERTIFTTNTSTLLPSMLAGATGRPEKFLALHFHDVRVTDIVDVMAHPATSEEAFKVVVEFSMRIGQVPIILKKENSGYVFNYMLTALFKAAQSLASNEVTTVEEIDRAWMGVLHTNIGPFGLMDSIGIDSVWKVTDYWAKESKDKQEEKNARFLKQFVERGHVGQKSGRGFYSYPDPAYTKPDFVRGNMYRRERGDDESYGITTEGSGSD
ncbi:MAG: 3-hydroxyacyl-CoA dehydrogenase [Deltaproteobacteria bacterium]|nr:3-hydroxyacyl-CoA dehydrogenase [Deltaproteobacteria bacterium]